MKNKMFSTFIGLKGRATVGGALLITALFAAVVYAAITVILAVGTIPDSAFFGGPATVTVRTLTIQPGEALPWHYHPGYAFNVVKSGVLTVEDGCTQQDETLTAGQAFEETQGHVHRAKNLGADPVVVYNTFLVPQGRPTTVNIPNNERKCGPPSTLDECMFGRWETFSWPYPFINQGECVAYLRHRPVLTLPVIEDPLR